MKKIRVLRDFTATQAVIANPQIIPPREPGKPYSRLKTAIVPRETIFVAGEEIETVEVPTEEGFKHISSGGGKRRDAVLDVDRLGLDFEFIA